MEPNFHEIGDPPSVKGITALSKSSIYVIPSPLIIFEVPGTIWANSLLKLIFDFSVVAKNGIVFIILVKNSLSLFILKSKPYFVFFTGSFPTLNLVIPPGLSFKWNTVNPKSILSSNLYSARAPDNHLVWKLNKSAFSKDIVTSWPEVKIDEFKILTLPKL